jgi:hypothetical protein
LSVHLATDSAETLGQGDEMFLYGSPDQIIPLATLLSTLSGFVLIFWGKIMRAADKIARWLSPGIADDKKPQA